MMSKADMAKVADVVEAVILATKKAEEPVKVEPAVTASEGDNVVLDPSIAPYIEAEQKLIKLYADSGGGEVTVYRGKYGSIRVNKTMEAIDNVRKMIKDMRAGKSTQRF